MPDTPNTADYMLTSRQWFAFSAAIAHMQHRRYPTSIWQKDAGLWRPEPEHQTEILNRLGWLHLPENCMEQGARLTSFADSITDQGFQHVVLLGMGGSSLAPWAFQEMFGVAEGYPTLAVLDSTAPSEVLASLGDNDITKTLFIVASKSGTTTEPLSFFEHFYARVEAEKGDDAGDNFIAITDPGSYLCEIASVRSFREIFENWPDHGGRYSVLSYFGMVPAALIGAPVQDILTGATAMAEACGPEVPAADNPGLLLGAFMASQWEHGRDKLTLLATPELTAFGEWVEQLIAESTGKMNRGIVPVVGETIGDLDVYEADRCFVAMHLAEDASLSNISQALVAAGHPVVDIAVDGTEAIGAEMFRWEFATAVAGAFMHINPFDQPDVQSAKSMTKAMLEEYVEKASLPVEEPDLTEDALAVYGSPEAHCPTEALGLLLQTIEPGDYFSIMAYIRRTPAIEDSLSLIRAGVRSAKHIATTSGYGPRFLHSTGQLHKGGPNTGVFLQITADDPAQADIPGQPYDFQTLISAQASGDLAVLRERGRRTLHIHITGDVEAGVDAIAAHIREALDYQAG